MRNRKIPLAPIIWWFLFVEVHDSVRKSCYRFWFLLFTRVAKRSASSLGVFEWFFCFTLEWLVYKVFHFELICYWFHLLFTVKSRFCHFLATVHVLRCVSKWSWVSKSKCDTSYSVFIKIVESPSWRNSCSSNWNVRCFSRREILRVLNNSARSGVFCTISNSTAAEHWLAAFAQWEARMII